MRGGIKRKAICLFLILAVICVAVYLYFTGASVIAEICTAEVNAKINDIINESNDVVKELDVFYADYFTVLYDNEKKISGILANTGLINQMTLIWNTEIQNRLNAMRLMSIRLPSGVFTGSALLAQFGAETEINTQVVSNCAITYESKFIHSGINQTLHRLVLYTEVVADVTVPKRAKDVKVTQEIILAETVLQGNVPDSYLIGEGSCDYIDLIP